MSQDVSGLDVSNTGTDDGAHHERKTRKQGQLKPCERCRSQHLKCVYLYSDEKCQRCRKSAQDCIQSSKKIRFRDVPVSRFKVDRKQGKQTTAVNQSARSSKALHNGKAEDVPNDFAPMAGVSNGKLKDDGILIDQEAGWHINEGSLEAGMPLSTKGLSNEIGATPTHQNASEDASTTNFQHDFSNNAMFVIPPIPTPSHERLPSISWHSPAPLARVISSDRGSNYSFNSASPQTRMRRTPTIRYIDSLVKPRASMQEQNKHSYLENVLLRYFHEELAPWFDLCDPDRHFANVIPQRARIAGPLRSAILTISARNLARNKRFRNNAGVVEWRGRPLPDLKEEFAVPYHNECIRNLLQLSLDPKKLHDENLLAAVLALRTDEEMGLNVDDYAEDQQLFLRIAHQFIDAQLPSELALPHSSPEVFPSTFSDDMSQSSMASPSIHTEDLGSSGLRQACFWTAFRQDLHAAFLKQQPVRFPLSRCELFRQLTPATDAIWANRMVTFCADVLEFSYGSDSTDGKVLPSYTNQDRWRELRDREQLLCSLLPATFEPTFCSEPDLLYGVFPEIWYLDPCHVSGTTYIELARMLLEVFNPTRPKLGHGFLAATNTFITSTRKILFRLCGIAISNHHCPPSLINACLGISMFGEYFDDPTEQEALLSVLQLMQDLYAYPTSQIAQSLRLAWNSGSPSHSSPAGSSRLLDAG